MIAQNIINKNFIVNFIISLIPISYICGNLILNLNIIILILCAFLFFGKQIFGGKLNIIDKLILLLFIYIFFNGLLNNFLNFSFPEAPNQNIVLIKSLFYLRFIILYFILKFLIENDLINYKLIFFAFGSCSLFVSGDVIFQYIFGKDIFGFEGTSRKLSGPFGDEEIAGSFVQRFFIFFPYALLFFIKFKKPWTYQLFFLFTLALCLFGTLLSGNRIPLFLFIIILGMIFIYQKQLRVTLLILSVIFVTTFSYLSSINENFKIHYINNFIDKSIKILDYTKIRISTGKIDDYANTHIKEIESGILTIQKNKSFGGGIKSFYFNCSSVENPVMKRYGGNNCNMHPHNYYIEIATALGLVGLLLIFLILATTIFYALKQIHNSNNSIDKKKLLIPFFIIFIVEIFPFKTTGSFFTTTNATFLFIIISFVVGLSEIKKTKKS
tara:strand:+ start:5666 stop:6985 length:1320 start_codon:yes stop_codon:yes gene_type:complete